MSQTPDNPPPQDDPDAPPQPTPGDEPVLDVHLTQPSGERDGRPLYRVMTLEWLGWALVMIGIILFVSLEGARIMDESPDLKFEIRGSLILFIIAAAFAWHKAGSRATHDAKYVFTNPEDACRFTRLTESGVSFGVPKVHETQYAWLYFNKYAITDKALSLYAGGLTLHIDISRASEQEQAQIRAGLARAFARPRKGLPFYVRHCLGCGYDLGASPGPDCPECGRPFHKLNYPNRRLGD